jgi:NADH-quinone oxidoreductase subunit M
MGMLFWLVAAPLIASLVVLLVPKAKPVFYKSVAALGIIVPLFIDVVAWATFNTGTTAFQHVSSIPWFTLPNVWLGANTTIGLSFGADGMSLALLSLGVVISLFVVLAVPIRIGYHGIQNATRTYLFWVLLVSTGVFGIFLALDLFTFLFALELSLFSTFFLIYLFGEKGRKKAAFKFLIYRGFATVLLILAFVGVAYGAAGGLSPNAKVLPPLDPALNGGTISPDMQAMLQQVHAAPVSFNVPNLMHSMHSMSVSAFPASWRMGLFLVLLFAVFIEEAFVPFHTWFPTTSETAETGTNMLIGGILTKTGAYVLIRFGVGLFPDQVRAAGAAIAIIGVINILYGAFAAWVQRDWRRLITFSSISHMGIVLLGIASMTSAGLQGAMFMLISSGLLTALLFYVTSAMRERTKTIMIPAMGGLAKTMPMLSGFLLVAALGSLGLPLTSGFISEFQSFIGGFHTYPAISFVGVIGLILSATYMLYAIRKTTFGPLPGTGGATSRAAGAGAVGPGNSGVTLGQGQGALAGVGQGSRPSQAEALADLYHFDARPIEYLPIIALTAMVLVIGVYPDVIGSLFNPSVHALIGIGG